MNLQNNMEDSMNNSMDKYIDSLGIRPDIAFLILIVFCIALIVCVILAKKNHLFYFSKKDTYNNTSEQELLQ